MMGGGYPGHTPINPIYTLTVRDVERLAKAGVVINFADIKDQVMPDTDHPPPEAMSVPQSLDDAFWQRWHRAHIKDFHSLYERPYDIHAHAYGDKVYVFVAPRDREPLIIEDVAQLYPSDALMAKIALLETTK
jgi:hypothetical protein